MSAKPTASALVIVSALAGAPRPAEPQVPPPPVFGVDVRIVAVPVFVTDKSGRAVPGLTADDFEIEDAGRSVPVAGFLTVDAGVPAPPAPGPENPRLVAASRRQFLLLFDLTFSSAPGMLKARKAALEFLEKGPQPGDLVAAARLSPAGVEVLVAFTPDIAQVARAVATLGTADQVRLRDPLGLAYDLGFVPSETTGKWGLQIQEAPRGEGENRGQVLQLARAEQNAYRQRVLGYVGELQRLAQLLDSVQGRKQVILLSGGFDQSVLLGAQGTERADNAQAVVEGRLWEVQSDRHFGDSQTRGTLDALFQALARSDTLVHTVDVAGLAAGGGVDEAGFVPTGSGQGSLAELAGRSGGRFVRDSNDLAAALREVLDASRYYYVLAFEPLEAKQKAGELRKLKIKVKRAGLAVSHRAGYTLPDAKAVAAPTAQMQAAEVIAKGLSGGALRLRAIAVPYRNPQGQSSLPVVLEIDGESLLGALSQKVLALEVYGYALDDKGRIEDALGLTPGLELDKLAPSIKAKGVQVLTAFRVREGPVDLRFLVRDRATGRVGSLRMTSVMPSFETGALLLSPPLVMDDPRARVVIPAPSRANQNLEIPFRVEDTPFTPQAAPVLRNGEARDVCLMAHAGSGADTAAKLSAALVGDDGQVLPLETGAIRSVADADRFRRLVVSVTPKGIPAGDYWLRLSIPTAPGAEESRSQFPVRVN
jgi:VWFA-related protein